MSTLPFDYSRRWERKNSQSWRKNPRFYRSRRPVLLAVTCVILLGFWYHSLSRSPSPRLDQFLEKELNHRLRSGDFRHSSFPPQVPNPGQLPVGDPRGPPDQRYEPPKQWTAQVDRRGQQDPEDESSKEWTHRNVDERGQHDQEHEPSKQSTHHDADQVREEVYDLITEVKEQIAHAQQDPKGPQEQQARQGQKMPSGSGVEITLDNSEEPVLVPIPAEPLLPKAPVVVQADLDTETQKSPLISSPDQPVKERIIETESEAHLSLEEKADSLPDLVHFPFEDVVKDDVLQGWEDSWVAHASYDVQTWGRLSEPKIDFVYLCKCHGRLAQYPWVCSHEQG